MAIYYYNFQMERGEYYGYVENSNGKDVWNVRYPDFYEDEESGELLESTTIFEDGFMKDATDIEGLEDYLKKMSILKSGDELEFIDDDDNYAHGGEINYKKIKRKGEDEKYGFKYIVREQGDNYVIVEDEKIEQWEKSSPVDRKMYYEDLLPKEEVYNEFEYFADGGVITAPKNYVFVKFGSHRAREKAKSKNIKFVSLFSFGERSSAGTSINFMTESDYRNIKDIVGVSLVKNLKGKWFPRDENVSLRKKIHPLLDEKFEFAKGGTINSRVKNKIKAQKPTELPLEVSVYVPSTREASQIISKRDYSQRIEEVQRYLADLFGGYSSVSVEGGYISKDVGFIQEDATRVVAFAEREDFEIKFDNLLKQIVSWCGKWSQESIGLEFEGDLFYIEATSKFKNGGNLTKSSNVRSLLSQFQKEKPNILLQMIADDVSNDFMRKKFDKTIVWENLTDSKKEKYNQDYRENKSAFIKYLIYDFVRLYYLDDSIKNKCKGESRRTISAIKSVMVSLAKNYSTSKYDNGGEIVGEYDDNNKFPTKKKAFELIEDSFISQGSRFVDEDGDGMFENEQDAKKYVNEVYDFFKYYYSLGVIPIYRSVIASEVDLDPYSIGESWSLFLDNSKRFGLHIGSQKEIKIISAYVPKNNVDWEKAFRLYPLFSNFSDGDAEFELPIPLNNKLYNVKVSDFKDAKELPKYADGGETDDDNRSYGRYEDYDDDFQKRMNLKNFNKANRVSSVGGRRLSNEYKDLDEDDHTSPIDIPYETFLKDYNSGKMAKGGLTYKDLSQEKPQIINDLDNKSKKFKVDELDIYRKGQKSFEGSSTITGSKSAVEIFRQFWDDEALSISEHMNVMLLNRANKVIGIYQHSKGGIAGTVLEPQMIVLVAVKSLAKGVIIAHNHPSGNLQPSVQDKQVSAKIKQALSLVDVTLLDSIIVTNDSYYSLMDEGFLERGGIMAKGGVIPDSINKLYDYLTSQFKNTRFSINPTKYSNKIFTIRVWDDGFFSYRGNRGLGKSYANELEKKFKNLDIKTESRLYNPQGHTTDHIIVKEK